MKRIIVTVLAVITVLTVLPLTASAYDDYVLDAPDVEMPLSAPRIDGVISPSEGWSAAFPFDEKYVARFSGKPMSDTAQLYFAYSADGLCFACDITNRGEVTVGNKTYDGNSLIYATAPDDVDRQGSLHPYGWNGDVMALALDPLGLLEKSEYQSAMWYDFSLFEDGVRVYRSNSAEEDITSLVTVAGAASDSGWRFECLIPWSLVASDLAQLTGGSITCTVPQLAAAGAATRADCIYIDRFMDPEAEEAATWGRYATCCAVTYDGYPGPVFTNGNSVKTYGLKLVNTGAAPRINPFTDVPSDRWYTEGVLYCWEQGYMNGVTADTFEPGTVMTRAMLALVLAQIDGVDLTEYTTSSFDDVTPGKWYAPAIEWLYRNGLASGISDGIFGYKNPVSREQLALFYMGYAAYKGLDTDARAPLDSYTDGAQIHEWAQDAVAWAVHTGLISGTGTGTTISPRDSATRAQIAQITMKYKSVLNAG